MNSIKIAMNITADYTKHYQMDRKYREEFIKEVIGGYGRLIYQGYTTNKQKPWLSEVHKVYDNGIIIIVNPYRGMDRIVTSKIARPGQIRAVYELPFFIKIENKKVITKNISRTPPSNVINKAVFYIQHQWNDDKNLPPKEDWEYWKQEVKKI